MVDRVLLGRRNDGSYGLDVSLPGVDVKSAQLHQMVFTSRWGNGAIIHQTGVVEDAYGKTVTFPALPYIPLVYLLIKNDENIQNTSWSITSDRLFIYPWAAVSNTAIRFPSDFRGPAPNYDCRYCVFRTPGR